MWRIPQRDLLARLLIFWILQHDFIERSSLFSSFNRTRFFENGFVIGMRISIEVHDLNIFSLNSKLKCSAEFLSSTYVWNVLSSRKCKAATLMFTMSSAFKPVSSWNLMICKVMKECARLRYTSMPSTAVLQPLRVPFSGISWLLFPFVLSIFPEGNWITLCYVLVHTYLN